MNHLCFSALPKLPSVELRPSTLIYAAVGLYNLRPYLGNIFLVILQNVLTFKR